MIPQMPKLPVNIRIAVGGSTLGPGAYNQSPRMGEGPKYTAGGKRGGPAFAVLDPAERAYSCMQSPAEGKGYAA